VAPVRQPVYIGEHGQGETQGYEAEYKPPSPAAVQPPTSLRYYPDGGQEEYSGRVGGQY